MAEAERQVDGHSSPRECDVCGKVVKGGGGLYSHLVLAHGVRRPNAETRYRQEAERLAAESSWKNTQIENLTQELASLRQDRDKWKRLSFEGNCKACGRDLWLGHKIEAIPVKGAGGRLAGTAFICK